MRGDTIDIYPASSEELITRVSFFGDEIEKIVGDRPADRQGQGRPLLCLDLPGHRIMRRPLTKMKQAVISIEAELEEQLALLRSQGKLIEAYRLEQRTRYDLEMLRETGFCKGIENYSRHLAGRAPGIAAVHPDRLFPARLPADDRRIACDRPADRRHVQRRPFAQGGARRLRLPPAVGLRQPAAAVCRI